MGNRNKYYLNRMIFYRVFQSNCQIFLYVAWQAIENTFQASKLTHLYGYRFYVLRYTYFLTN